MLGAVAVASLLVAAPWEPMQAGGRYALWAGLVAVTVGAAGDAGRNRGGILAGWRRWD